MCRAGYALDPSKYAFSANQSSKEQDMERQATDEGMKWPNVLVADSAGNGICLAE